MIIQLNKWSAMVILLLATVLVGCGSISDKKSLTELEIKELNAVIGRPVIPEALIQRLEEKGIKTLEDIRRIGGIPPLEGLSPEEEQAVKTLEAHAVLTVLSSDAELNAKLIEKGFESLSDIARSTQKDFIAAARKAGIKEDIACAIHAKATKIIRSNKKKEQK